MKKKIQYHFGDYFGAPFEIGLHVCNLYHTFGAGIAKRIKAIFPEAYEIDLSTIKGDKNKLGTISLTNVKKHPEYPIIQYIGNLYAMTGMGTDKRQLSYDKLIDCLNKVNDEFRSEIPPYSIGIPFNMGCGLAGGEWSIVEAIIEDCFQDYPGAVLVCVREEDRLLFNNR